MHAVKPLLKLVNCFIHQHHCCKVTFNTKHHMAALFGRYSGKIVLWWSDLDIMSVCKSFQHLPSPMNLCQPSAKTLCNTARRLKNLRCHSLSKIWLRLPPVYWQADLMAHTQHSETEVSIDWPPENCSANPSHFAEGQSPQREDAEILHLLPEGLPSTSLQFWPRVAA